MFERVEKFPGSRGLRDTENGVRIDIVVTGDYPGDGLLPLAKLIELKLASGMSAPHRLRDLADVLELIPVPDLSLEMAADLDESVREKYRELWQAAHESHDDE